MKTTLVILAALSLGGCASIPGTGGANGDAIAAQVLQNLEHCRRTYTASVGIGAAGSLNIECPAKPYE
jgi:acyl CoA:acetate/3-ketoacid CoA transferase beta subunit